MPHPLLDETQAESSIHEMLYFQTLPMQLSRFCWHSNSPVSRAGLNPASFQLNLLTSDLVNSLRMKRSWNLQRTTVKITNTAKLLTAKLAVTDWGMSIIIGWRLADSNRWHPACKAGALPTELNPQTRMGHPGLEPGTSPLSGVRSNHLS